MSIFSKILLISAICPVNPECSGDMNGDYKVNLAEETILNQEFGATNCSEDNNWCKGSDLTCDGNVNLADLTSLRQKFGKSCTLEFVFPTPDDNDIIHDDNFGINLTIENFDGSILVGHGAGTGTLFNGSIDELIVYNRVIKPEEVKALYQIVSPKDNLYVLFENLVNGNYDFEVYLHGRFGNILSTETRTVQVDV